jgi:hypothetical protein
VKPLPAAHAHNDYKHRHPLSDAMHCGFTSFEADVFLKKDRLIVAHISPFLQHKTLEQLYLEPLYDSVIKNKGAVYPSWNGSVILLIDIKSGAANTYAALKPLLEKYASILTHVENGKIYKGAVTVILSGHKPIDAMLKDDRRLAFIDESLFNLSSVENDSIVFPLASTKYSTVLSWKGKGKINKTEDIQLKALIALAHLQGKKVRLWASPENTVVWRQLLDYGVDLINTDDLDKLQDFLLKGN